MLSQSFFYCVTTLMQGSIMSLGPDFLDGVSSCHLLLAPHILYRVKLYGERTSALGCSTPRMGKGVKCVVCHNHFAPLLAHTPPATCDILSCSVAVM